ncbi:unnamed protein product [Auanema sp. JU1783]|nr:unnamed protein product [Auanema sp. JU1783]
MNYTVKKRFEDDVSNFTTPAHSRQTSSDNYQPLIQTPLLARLTQEFDQDHYRTIPETEEPDEAHAILHDSLIPHHTRAVSEVLSSGHYHSTIPEEYRAYGETNTVQYQSSYRNVDIVQRSAEDIIRESVRENYYKNYAGDLALPTAVVSAERRSASSHLNLHESSIAADVWANMKAELFLEIPIIRENTFENPWSYQKFLERQPYLVRSNSDHTVKVDVRSEVNLAEAKQLIQARYFSERLLASVDISFNQVGEQSRVLLLSEEFSPRSLHFLLYCGQSQSGTQHGSTLIQNVETNIHHQSSSSHLEERRYDDVSTTSMRHDYTYVPAATTVLTTETHTQLADQIQTAIPTYTPITNYEAYTVRTENTVAPAVTHIPAYTPITNYEAYTVRTENTVEPAVTTSYNYSYDDHHQSTVRSYSPTPAFTETYRRTEEIINHEPVTTNVTSYETHSYVADEVIQTAIPSYTPITTFEAYLRTENTVEPAVTTAQDYTYETRISNSYGYNEPVIYETPAIASHETETHSVQADAYVESTTLQQSQHFTAQEEYHYTPTPIPIRQYDSVIHRTEVTHEEKPYIVEYDTVTTTVEPTATYDYSTTYQSNSHNISTLYDEIQDTITHIQFPLHGSVTHVHTTEEHVEHVTPVLAPIIEERTVTVTDNSVTTLREQLLTCEEKLRQKEVYESSRRHELELRSEQDRIRCQAAEANVLDLTVKLETCERKRREESSLQTSVHQAVLEEKSLRQQSETEIHHLRAKLHECQQALVHERSVQSANFLEMQQRAEKEHITGQEYEVRFNNLHLKFKDLEYQLKQQQQSEHEKLLAEERKYQEIHQRGQDEIAALKYQLRNYEVRVQQESIDISAFKAQEAELAKQKAYIAQRERDLSIQLTEYNVRHSQELKKIREEEERLRREVSSLQLAKSELERVHAHSQTSIREEYDMYQRELALSNERLRKQSADLKLKIEEINLLKKQLEESKQKERIYDEVHDDNQGSPRSRRGNLQFETFETKTVIQRSTREYTVDENDYEEIGGYKKQEHIYEEPKTTAVNKVVYAEADTTDNHKKRHLIDVTIPKTSVTVGVSVGNSGSEHKFEKNIYDDVATTDLTIGTGAGVSSSKIISMSKRNNWGDEEVSSTTGHYSAIPHVESIPPPLNITPSTVGRGVEVTDESGRKHTAVRVDQTSYSPKEHHDNHHHHQGLVEKARLRYEEVLKNNSPSYSSSGSSHTFEKEVSDNMVTSTEEVFKQEVTVVESVSSPYTIENRPHVADLRRQFERGSTPVSPVPPSSPARHVLSPPPSEAPTHQAPSPTPSHDGTGKRHVTRSVNNYVATPPASVSIGGSKINELISRFENKN